MSSIKKDTFTLTATLASAADGTVLPVPTSARLLAVYMNCTTAPSADATATIKKNGTATTVTGTLVAATKKGSILPTSATAAAQAEIDAGAATASPLDDKGQYGGSVTYANGISYGVSGTNYIGATFPSDSVLVDFVAGDTVACALGTATNIAGGVAVLVFEKI